MKQKAEERRAALDAQYACIFGDLLMADPLVVNG